MLFLYGMLFMAFVNIFAPLSLLIHQKEIIFNLGLVSSLYNNFYFFSYLWLLLGIILFGMVIIGLYYKKVGVYLGFAVSLFIYLINCLNYFPFGSFFLLLISGRVRQFYHFLNRVLSTLTGAVYFWSGFLNTITLLILLIAVYVIWSKSETDYFNWDSPKEKQRVFFLSIGLVSFILVGGVFFKFTGERRIKRISFTMKVKEPKEMSQCTEKIVELDPKLDGLYLSTKYCSDSLASYLEKKKKEKGNSLEFKTYIIYNYGYQSPTYVMKSLKTYKDKMINCTCFYS